MTWQGVPADMVQHDILGNTQNQIQPVDLPYGLQKIQGIEKVKHRREE